jgi:hypothetical protein
VRSQTNEVIVAGDFNAQIAGQGHSFSNGNGSVCLEMMRATNMGLIPQTKPTFIREQTGLAEERKSTIDHFIVSRSILNSYNACETKNDFTGSDHDILELRFGLVVPITKPNPGRNCQKLTFDKTNKQYQRLLGQQEARLKLIQFSDMEIMYDRYTKAICSAADKAIHNSMELPYQPKKVRNIRALAKAEHWKMRTIGTTDE